MTSDFCAHVCMCTCVSSEQRGEVMSHIRSEFRKTPAGEDFEEIEMDIMQGKIQVCASRN